MRRPSYTHSPSSPSELRLILGQADIWTHARRSLPKLSGGRLEQARNSRLGTEKNNDLMEFVGDRIVNLACALMVAKDSFCPDQQVVVDRAVSSNDALGRLAYQLHLHKKARLDDVDSEDISGWGPQHYTSPPKVLADLFEAYTGAVYEEHGWEATKDWLGTIFTPLIEKATEDYLNQSALPGYLNQAIYISHELLDNPVHQEKLHDYLEFKAKQFLTMAEPALSALPRSTKFVFGAKGDIGNDRDMVEIATHLVKFWVCEIFMSLYPENREALLKGPHLISSITILVTNTWTLGCLGSLLKLESFFDVEDPDFSLFNKRLKSPRSETAETNNRKAAFRGKLTQAVYAMIGWYHSKDAAAAKKWGIKWLRPLVTRAHDILMEDPSFKPCLPHGADDTLTLHAAALTTIRENQDTIPAPKEEDELEARFAAMMIKDKENRERKLNSEDAVVHRLIIDLDENDLDDDADADADADDGDNKCSLVEDLIPAVQNLKIGISHRPQTTNSVSAPLKKIIKVVLHSGDTDRLNHPPHPTEKDAKDTKAVNGVWSEAVSVVTNTIIQKEEPAMNTPKPVVSPLECPTTQAAGNKDRRPDSKERPREPKSMRNRLGTSQPDVAPIMPRHREPPREPRTTREQRNREQRLAIPKSSGGGEPRRSRSDEKENEGRCNVRNQS